MKRIKRALAAFLRDELLEYIGYNHNIPYMTLDQRFVMKEVAFDVAIMEKIITISDHTIHEIPNFFEDQIEECKKEFARNIMDHIHVDTTNLINEENYMNRSVKLILRVQEKKDLLVS